ncbi:interferon-induced protein 44-like [Dicentrarchus labrax]|uniref:G domain-containing protein n=1 Tax=Dicentrarchus labrax TaxID=13489 RepID=A0A8C4GDY3_DICLA|nr:interferon-induced protein 44-like [Dicentrarchus labrax]
MGPKQSKSDQPQLLSEPWRKINWQDKQSALKYVQDYKPHIEGQQLRILLHGPPGAGKSSFINSVKSVLRQRMCNLALVDNTSGDSFTQKFTTYKIQKGNPDSFYPFVFNDIMGLDASSEVLVDDVKLALKGHVKNGYVFNPRAKLSEGDQFYNKNPSSNDKVHVLVCVVPADTATVAQDETMKRLREIRLEARDLGIPQVAIITKIDKVCPELRDDLKNVYKTKALKQKMEQFSVDMGIPMNCIFPVKNYHEEIDLNDDTDLMILSTLKYLINFGEDFINFKHQSEQSDTYA